MKAEIAWPVGLLLAAALAFGVALSLATGCAGAAQDATDSASNFSNLLADQECARQARQAATGAALAVPSDAGPNAEKHARHVAALAAFDACESKKDGGL